MEFGIYLEFACLPVSRVLGFWDFKADMPEIKKILFITLSNIGDVILTLPILDYLKSNFPSSKITVMVGPRAKEILENNPYIDRLIIYDKYSRLKNKIRLFEELKKERFDLVVDLRNTLYGALLPASYRTSPFLRVPRHIRHMKDSNLYRLQKALKIRSSLSTGKEKSFCESEGDRDYINTLLKKNGLDSADKIILVSFGTGGDTRRWDGSRFSRLCSALSQEYKVILVGSKINQPAAGHIRQNCPNKIFDFTGQTTLKQFAYLLKISSLLITCDTGTLQLAGYLDVPIVALFGPSDERKYGPWSARHKVVKKEVVCRPCRRAHCRFNTAECMKLIKVEDVVRAVKEILTDRRPSTVDRRPHFKRILIVRTDRIGDVLLSTPVIKALRDSYPDVFISMMVSPYTKDITEGNPYLDEVIIYDKKMRHRGWFSSFKFALALKKKKFDLAVILHPTNRVHIVTFFAGIPKRIGYDRKFSFLLTDRIKHDKQFGEKHELEYCLDLVRVLGIETKDKNLFIPINPTSEKWVEELLGKEGVETKDILLAIHSGASCPSKIWPNERFSEVADRLSDKYGFKVLLIAGPKDIAITEKVLKAMHSPAINLAGKVSVSQLASVLKRTRLLISNDSGPVHIASAVGTPVISIFGRNQKGLSPKRWGPVGPKDRVLHKEVGCIKCIAHDCTKGFACLKAITVSDVIDAADAILKT
ncbi:MAG: lipopolysaccharide heptosyltransferase II [Candidatus Omnitrophota bacterium]